MLCSLNPKKIMEPVHFIMDLVIPPLIFIALLMILPPYLIYKFFLTILKLFTVEDMSGKVVIITGASSGIGEHMAYQYAKKGARLALVARREQQLREVAEKARRFGCPEVICACGDVSKPEDCKRFVEKTVNHFGRLDHLVNNAGIVSGFYFEESIDIINSLPIMNVNFWGSIYSTHFALPHLKKTKGRIVINASLAGWLYGPDMSFYGASKAAIINFYDTLRIEFGSSVNITIASPGFVESEMSQGKHLSKDGAVEVDKEKREAVVGFFPVRGVEECAKTIVNGVCRGDRYVTDPSWYRILYVCKVFVPEVVEWFFRMLFVVLPKTMEKNATAKKMSDANGTTKLS